MEWRELMSIPQWTHVRDLDFPMKDLWEDFCEISENIYGMTVPHKVITADRVKEGPFLTGILWACSEGAARRAVDHGIESDDGIIVSPPGELLPYRDGLTYEEIEHGLRSIRCEGVAEFTGHRLLPDGAFLHRGIQSVVATYFFRSGNEDDDELPYAIQWNLKGIPKGWGQNRPRRL